jgi:hypothetical protein
VAKLKELRIPIKFCFDIETPAPEIYELPSEKLLEGYLHFRSSQTSVKD